MTESAGRELMQRGYTRRDLLRAAALLTAGTSLPFYNEAALAQTSALGRRLEPWMVKINANENPAGPSPAALEAYLKVARDGGRYNYEEASDLTGVIARQEGVPERAIGIYPGSSLALHHAVIACTSPSRGLVTADPGYEPAANAAEFIGAKVIRVPLKPDGAQDIRAMVAAAEGAGALYLCNPNNPTAAVIPHEELRYAVENCPRGTAIILDEAYIHFTDEPRGAEFVRAGRDVIVLRTFSKIYGMAGLRAGFAMAAPQRLAAMRGYSHGAMPAPAMAAARVMLEDADLVPQRKREYDALRGDLEKFFNSHGFKFVKGCSNKIFVDTGKPANRVIAAMADEGVFIGRPWPAWPSYARVTIGTAAEMETFKEKFLKVMS